MKDIKGYEGRYAATEDGRIWSHVSNKFLKPVKRKDGYYKVTLSDKYCSVKYYLLHRIIAETFLENPENKPTVDHIDRNKDNNNISNLRWATHSEQVFNENTDIVHSKEHMQMMCEKARLSKMLKKCG